MQQQEKLRWLIFGLLAIGCLGGCGAVSDETGYHKDGGVSLPDTAALTELITAQATGFEPQW